MRIIESILKIAFVILAIYVILTHDISSYRFIGFLVISALLGIVLVFNHRSSYGSWGNSHRDFMMRRFEGLLLIVAAACGFFIK